MIPICKKNGEESCIKVSQYNIQAMINTTIMSPLEDIDVLGKSGTARARNGPHAKTTKMCLMIIPHRRLMNFEYEQAKKSLRSSGTTHSLSQGVILQ